MRWGRQANRMCRAGQLLPTSRIGRIRLQSRERREEVFIRSNPLACSPTSSLLNTSESDHGDNGYQSRTDNQGNLDSGVHREAQRKGQAQTPTGTVACNEDVRVLMIRSTAQLGGCCLHRPVRCPLNRDLTRVLMPVTVSNGASTSS